MGRQSIPRGNKSALSGAIALLFQDSETAQFLTESSASSSLLKPISKTMPPSRKTGLKSSAGFCYGIAHGSF
jgi:hypothetical protein